MSRHAGNILAVQASLIVFYYTYKNNSTVNIYRDAVTKEHQSKHKAHTSSRQGFKYPGKGYLKVRLTFTLTQNFRPFLNVMALYRRSPDTFIS